MNLILSSLLALASTLPTLAQINIGATGCPGMPRAFALTFDDGPSQSTRSLLAVLKEKNVNATFFVIGANAQMYPEILKDTYNAGHLIASHSFSHPNFANLKPQEAEREILAADSVFHSLIGVSPRLFRYPYGSTSATSTEVIKNLGKTPVYWNVDTKDWNLYNTKDAAKILTDVAPLVAAVNGREGIINLQHDLYIESISYVGRIIDWARDNRFQIVTIAQCLGMANPYSTDPVPPVSVPDDVKEPIDPNKNGGQWPTSNIVDSAGESVTFPVFLTLLLTSSSLFMLLIV